MKQKKMKPTEKRPTMKMPTEEEVGKERAEREEIDKKINANSSMLPRCRSKNDHQQEAILPQEPTTTEVTTTQDLESTHKAPKNPREELDSDKTP